MGKNRLRRGCRSLGGGSGLAPSVRTVYCARAVEPLLDSIKPDPVYLTRPSSVPPKHAQFAKGQIPYRPTQEDPLSVQKLFSAKGIRLLMRKDFGVGKTVKA